MYILILYALTFLLALLFLHFRVQNFVFTLVLSSFQVRSAKFVAETQCGYDTVSNICQIVHYTVIYVHCSLVCIYFRLFLCSIKRQYLETVHFLWIDV